MFRPIAAISCTLAFCLTFAAHAQLGPPPAQDDTPAKTTTKAPPPPKLKKTYSGPTDVVELPATPVLDANGKPVLDADGKPMMNPPVRQMRDKKGRPVFDNGKPVFQTASDMGYDEKGRKIALPKPAPLVAMQQPVPATTAPAMPPPMPTGKVKKTKDSRESLTTIAELPATPALDAYGKPLLDADGKPVMDPPVRQMRDKKGHPVFDNGKPVFQTASDMGYDEKGHRIPAPKVVAAAHPATAPAAIPEPDIPAPAVPVAVAKVKKGKDVYEGPTTVVVLDPTPVLDQEGRQRLDPDGKPMFNPAIKQLRDKKGHPVFDNGKPVFQTAKDLGYDEKGKKIDVIKEKAPKTIIVNVTHGTFTVDGLTSKAQLNYEIHDLKFFYFYVPWIGTTVISNSPFPGSKEQKDAFVDKTLTVNVEDHTLQLYSDTRLLEKKPQPAYVLVDRDFKLPTSNPTVGFGATSRAPYEWPGAKQDKPQEKAHITPPPLPENMRPQLLLSPCPTGQMRKPGPRPLPGQTAQVQPCIPISAAIATPKPMPAPVPPPPAATAPPQ